MQMQDVSKLGEGAGDEDGDMGDEWPHGVRARSFERSAAGAELWEAGRGLSSSLCRGSGTEPGGRCPGRSRTATFGFPFNAHISTQVRRKAHPARLSKAKGLWRRVGCDPKSGAGCVSELGEGGERGDESRTTVVAGGLPAGRVNENVI